MIYGNYYINRVAREDEDAIQKDIDELHEVKWEVMKLLNPEGLKLALKLSDKNAAIVLHMAYLFSKEGELLREQFDATPPTEIAEDDEDDDNGNDYNHY